MPFPTIAASEKHLRAKGFIPSPDKVKRLGAWRAMRRDTMRFMYADIVPTDDGGAFTIRGIAFYNDGEKPSWLK
jgi:hypothetical protein